MLLNGPRQEISCASAPNRVSLRAS